MTGTDEGGWALLSLLVFAPWGLRGLPHSRTSQDNCISYMGTRFLQSWSCQVPYDLALGVLELTSAMFYRPGKSLRPAQIQREGNRTPSPCEEQYACTWGQALIVVIFGNDLPCVEQNRILVLKSIWKIIWFDFLILMKTKTKKNLERWNDLPQIKHIYICLSSLHELNPPNCGRIAHSMCYGLFTA